MDDALNDHDLWPLPSLRVRSADLELRYLDDATVLALGRLAAEGIHEPGRMPFAEPWSVGTPVEVARRTVQYHWRLRSAGFGPDLRIAFAVVRDTPEGEVLVGTQALTGEGFALTRSAETGSWLGRRYQGQGIGTQMRAMILYLLFEGFEAQVVTTDVFTDNPASNAVTRRLGYARNGTRTVVRDGVAATLASFRLTREAWSARTDRPRVELFGVEPVRRMLGL